MTEIEELLSLLNEKHQRVEQNNQFLACQHSRGVFFGDLARSTTEHVDGDPRFDLKFKRTITIIDLERIVTPPETDAAEGAHAVAALRVRVYGRINLQAAVRLAREIRKAGTEGSCDSTCMVGSPHAVKALVLYEFRHIA